jgi:hypothetical protein
MTVNRYLRLIAGLAVLLGTLLSWLVSPWFLLFVAFVGVNLLQSAFTNWCPMMWVLRLAGVEEEGSCSPVS